MKYAAPKSWTTRSLGELTEGTRPICYGVLKPGDFVRDGIPLVRVTDISENRFDGSNIVRISPYLDSQFKRSRLRGGEILLSIQGTVGRVAICPSAYAGANISRTIAVIQPDSRVDRQFAYWFLRFLGERGDFHTVGTTRSSLNIETLRKVGIPMPPLREQRRIAEILDRAEALRAKRRAALTQLDSLIQAIFVDLFGDPTTNPKGWPRKPIAEIGTVITGNTPPRANPSYYGRHIEWIKSDNINTPHYYLTQATEGLSESGKAVARTAPVGSILVTCIAGSPECIGNAAMTDREVAFNQQINAFVPTNGNAHFLYAQILVGKRLIQEASTAGMKGMVSKGRFERILLILPPIKLQSEFARQVAAVEKLKAVQRSSLGELDFLFASLQHRAFRGEL